MLKLNAFGLTPALTSLLDSTHLCEKVYSGDEWSKQDEPQGLIVGVEDSMSLDRKLQPETPLSSACKKRFAYYILF